MRTLSISRDHDLVDALGTRHVPAGPEARIACFVPSITELVIELGLAAQLVARTRFCIHPAAAVAKVPALGGTKKVSIARLKPLAPTHAIVNVEENTEAMDRALREFVPHVIVTYPKRPLDNPPLYRLIGGIFGKDAEALALVCRFEGALDASQAARAALPPRRVLYLIWKDPWMGVSRHTYIAAMLALANFAVLGHRDGVDYPELVIDAALLADADCVLFSSEPYPFKERDLDDFARTYAVSRDKLRLIDGEYCSWYGPRAIAGVEYLTRFAANIP